MCNFFDDFDAEDFAFWGGFILTQLEGEQAGQQQQKETSDDLLEVYDPVADDEQAEEKTDDEEW